MIQVNIISSLVLNNNGLQIKDRKVKLIDISLQQGSLDGACSIYSVFMNLLILRKISLNDIQVFEKPKDIDTRNLCKKLLEENGMHHDGQTFYRIQRILNDNFGTKIATHHPKAVQKEVIPLITEQLKKDLPVIISIVYDNGSAHALLCVGYENIDQKVTKLFCLDPGSQKLKNSYWNTVIDLEPNTNRIKYPFHYISTDSTAKEDIGLEDILIITPRE